MNDQPADSTHEPQVGAPHRHDGRRATHKRVALLLATAALIVLGYFAQPYLKLLGPPERCWEIQEVDGKLYKVNPCTGQFRLIGDVPAAGGAR